MSEKYYITNGDKVIAANNCPGVGIKYKPVIGSADIAYRFKHNEGLNFIEDSIRSSKEWGVQKMFDGQSKRNYVVTTATKFAAGNGIITDLFSKAKSFDSVSDAELYIKNHREVAKTFGNVYIVNDKLEKPDISEHKISASKQLINTDTVKKSTARKIFSKNVRINIYENANHKCCICGKPINFNEMTIDHEVPLSRGGANSFSNLRCVCKSCNRLKGDRLDQEMYTELINMCAEKVIDNPDDDLWNSFIRAKVRGAIKKYSMQNN